MEVCDKHEKLCERQDRMAEDVAVIKSKLTEIDSKITAHATSHSRVNMALMTVIMSIILQITSFAYLWGGLTNTVKKNTEYVWNDMTPRLRASEISTEKILSKLETIKLQVIRTQ